MFLIRKYAPKFYHQSRNNFSMLVTQKNFNDFYNDLKTNLPNADFYSIDFELTGIKTNEPETISDLPYERYHKLRGAANKYRIIQVGLCLFTVKADNEIEARPYNIFVFPRERPGYSPQILMDVSAIEFNSKNKMSWDTWIYDGVTYMTLREAKKKRDDLLISLNTSAGITTAGEIILVKESDREKSDKFIADLLSWKTSESKEPFNFKESTKYFRKYVYDLLKKDHPELLVKTVQNEENINEKTIQIFKAEDEDDKKSFMMRKKQQLEEELLGQLGFTSIIELLVESKKKLIGHNCYLDLLFLYSHFVDYVPHNYHEFKSKLFELFPQIYDTKFIATNTKFQNKLGPSSALVQLLNMCFNKDDTDLSPMNIKLAEGFEDYSFDKANNLRLHEAGYDAFITGYVYAKMFYGLTSEEQERVANSVNVMKSFHFFKNGLVADEEPFFKKNALVHVIRSGQNAPLDVNELRTKIKNYNIQDSVKYQRVENEAFKGLMLICEPDSDLQYILYNDLIESITSKGLEALTYKQFLDLKIQSTNPLK